MGDSLRITGTETDTGGGCCRGAAAGCWCCRALVLARGKAIAASWHLPGFSSHEGQTLRESGGYLHDWPAALSGQNKPSESKALPMLVSKDSLS